MAISNDIIEQLIGNVKTEEELFGSDGLLKQLSKQLLERVLESELTSAIGHEKYSKTTSDSKNYRNGKTSKIVKTGNGDISVDIPRDRNGEYEPLIIKRHQRRLEGFSSLKKI